MKFGRAPATRNSRFRFINGFHPATGLPSRSTGSDTLSIASWVRRLSGDHDKLMTPIAVARWRNATPDRNLLAETLCQAGRDSVLQEANAGIRRRMVRTDYPINFANDNPASAVSGGLICRSKAPGLCKSNSYPCKLSFECPRRAFSNCDNTSSHTSREPSFNSMFLPSVILTCAVKCGSPSESLDSTMPA